MTGCSGSGSHRINLMPAPEVYDSENINPFTDNTLVEWLPNSGILYATDRQPSAEDDSERYYRNERGHVLRLGMADIAIGNATLSWEDARRISLLKDRGEEYPLQVTAVEEFGILDRSVDVLMPPDIIPGDPREPARRFSQAINDKLAVSGQKDIYIYVPGYKVVFENPMLVAAELWHFLGYEGVFISYAWPAIPSRWAYLADIATATYSARNLRVFLQYLSEETDAQHIHIIGYSAGTRVVLTALSQLALENRENDTDAIGKRLRIGHVILAGSDHDRDVFGSYLDDGLLRVTENLTLYMSREDQALDISRFLFARDRLGQMVSDEDWEPAVVQYLRENTKLTIIDVTGAESATTGNGHAYFRGSPWVSSDILMSLRYDLQPAERGIIVNDKISVWSFPDDYISRLRARLNEHLPGSSNQY
jgi:esterase/lipase superfamily enzyme